MQKKTKQTKLEKNVALVTFVPEGMAAVLNKAAKSRVPRISRKALLYLIISKAVRRIEAKGK